MKHFLPLLTLGALSLCASPTSLFRIECKQTEPSTTWRTQKADWASQGDVLQAHGTYIGSESDPQDFRLPKPGTYQLALRYMAKQNARANFILVLRNAQQEIVHVEYVDWARRLPQAKPYMKPVGSTFSGPTWHVFQFNAETAGGYRISFLPLFYSRQVKGAPRVLDCFLVGDKLPHNLKELTPADLAKIPLAPASAKDYSTAKLETYAGCSQRPFRLGLINNASFSVDTTNQILLGVNRDHGNMTLPSKPSFAQKTYAESGFKTLIEGFTQHRPDLDKKFPFPQGRFVNSKGQVSRNTFSLLFDPYWEEINQRAVEIATKRVATGLIDQLSFSTEWGGFFDYSEPAQLAFRSFLKEKYGSLDKLNAEWKTNIKEWKDVHPPKKVQDQPTAFYDFHEFSSKTFSEFLGKRKRLYEKHVPGVEISTQFSNLNTLAAWYKSHRPMDYEDIVNMAFKGSGSIGWDTYCVDDYMGAEIDYLDSVANGLPLINQETNIHSEHPDLMARTFWINVGKGVKGFFLFMNQEGVIHDSYPKWALHNPDFSHKDKLGAVSDAMHEVHRFEPLLVDAKRRLTVKPILIYYSKLDMLYRNPFLSLWGEDVNSPYRVYELFRGLGYPVRFVTASQIAQGKLKDGAALVLSYASVIPDETRRQILDYIRNGGVAIADMQPGIKNRHDDVTPELMKAFGVEPVAPKKSAKSSELALQESGQGYGEITINALDNKDLPSSVFEFYQQTDSTHPILKGLYPFMISGLGLQKIRCVDGEVVGMCFGGQPGIVVNTLGKGKTLYLAGMLGSIYGGSCTMYEFDDVHAGTAPYRLLDNFLRWAGAMPHSHIDLPEKAAHRVRIEDPLVDSRGNAMIAMVSYNVLRLPPTTMELVWPTSLPAPKHLYAFTDKERNLIPITPVLLPENRIRFTMPAFSTHAALLAMKDFTPVISLTCDQQKPGEMLSVAPEHSVRFQATVHAMSDQPLKAGKVTLALPLGWNSKTTSVDIPALPPWGQYSFEFEVKAPPCRALRKVRPITLRFKNQDVTSTPASFVLWFN